MNTSTHLGWCCSYIHSLEVVVVRRGRCGTVRVLVLWCGGVVVEEQEERREWVWGVREVGGGGGEING